MTCGPYLSCEDRIPWTQELVPVCDNTKPHTAHIIRQYFAKNQITLLNHPPYSPDLAQLDFFFNFRKSNWKWREHFFRMWMRFRRWWRGSSRRFLSTSVRTASNHCIAILRTVSHGVGIMFKPSIVFLNKFYIWCPYEFLFGNLLDIR